ncbi:MAG: hypothetical protein M3460_02135 [Actinomycetota bacterium]|nr:hypothetical protein [Actinomycetota bacterium]
MSTTTIELLEATRAHLCEFELPAPWSVTVNTCLGKTPVEIHLHHRDSPELASALLAWADTLTGVTAEAWRVRDNASVHLSITGQLRGGAWLRVYGGMPYTEHGLGADLDPDTTTTLLLSALRHHASTEEITRS